MTRAAFNTASLKWNRVAGTRGVVRLSSTLSAVASFEFVFLFRRVVFIDLQRSRTHLQLQTRQAWSAPSQHP